MKLQKQRIEGGARKRGIARFSRAGARATVLAIGIALAGCAFAPGMRMITSEIEPAVQAAAPPGADDSDGGDTSVLEKIGAASPEYPAQASGGAFQSRQIDATATAPAIPLIELDIALVRRMQDERRAQHSRQARLMSDEPQSYVVGSGDVLQIVVWDHPEIASATGSASQQTARPADPPPGFVVDSRGYLTFPYAGALRVAGLRSDEIQHALSAALSHYFVKPQVTVRVASYRARAVYVDGEVRNPGEIAVNDIPMSLSQALARAGGFGDNADQSDLQLVRDGTSERVNLTRMLEDGINPSNLYLKPGDLLRVAARDDNDVYVMGEVSRPVAAVPRRSGRITLADALAQAGSVNAATADAAQMFVIRGALDGTPQIFHLDGSSPVAMLVAKEFDLQPKDVVYVDGNGLVRFNRVLALLMPAINAGLTAGLVSK